MADESNGAAQNVKKDMSICISPNFDTSYEDETVWGELIPNNETFERVLLKKDEIICGRRPDADIILKSNTKYVNVGTYSNTHFIIKREKYSNKDEYYSKIEDKSSNGTFVNGAKIGKGRFTILKSADEISLSRHENKAFRFIDKKSRGDYRWPIQIREKYVIRDELGKGAYGEVKLAFSNQTMEKFAIKLIRKRKFTIRGKHELNYSNQIMSEVNILKKLNHPCIIKIFEVIDTPLEVFIVFELVEGGDLFDKVVSIEKYTEKTAKLLFYQMVLAIKYLHDQGISHRDLKPENILLCDKEKTETLIKITDFGLSNFFDTTCVMKTFCGTPNYLAPEVLITEGAGTYTNKIDNWSLGVILYIMLGGYPPFSDEASSKLSLEQQILTGAYDFPDVWWSDISKEAIDLVKRLLTTDPAERYTLEQVLEHEWIKNDEEAKQLAQKLMYRHSDSTNSIQNGKTNEIPNEDNSSTASSNKLKRNHDDTESEALNELIDTNAKLSKPNNSNSTEKSVELP